MLSRDIISLDVPLQPKRDHTSLSKTQVFAFMDIEGNKQRRHNHIFFFFLRMHSFNCPRQRLEMLGACNSCFANTVHHREI